MRDRKSEQIWNAASDVFHSSASKTEFVRLQRERHQTLGNFLRVIEYKSGSKKYGDQTATFTGLVEYQSGVVSAAVGFARADERSPWLLNSFKVVLPMPRADERAPDDEGVAPAIDRPRPPRTPAPPAAPPAAPPPTTPAGPVTPAEPPAAPAAPTGPAEAPGAPAPAPPTPAPDPKPATPSDEAAPPAGATPTPTPPAPG